LECDAAGKQDLAQQATGVIQSYFSHGEAVALLPEIRRPESESRVKVKLLPAHKLTQQSDGFRKFQGVTMDRWGMPLAYELNLRVKQPFDELVTIPARDNTGKPQVLHIFDGRPEDVRGITPFAPALRPVRYFDQLGDVTMTSELLRAIFAATIHSEAPTDAILQALQDQGEQGVGAGSIGNLLEAKAGWYQSTKIDLGRSGRIAHLFPGEELKFHTAENHATAYEQFAKFLLREIARCIGLTFETLTGDYSGATYSSVRMATSEIWPIILRRRANIVARFYQQVYELWLREEIATGRIEFPDGLDGYQQNRAAASIADWRGPPKPQADDLKTSKAHETYKRIGVMTDEMICADLGQDWEEVYEQRAREKALRDKLKLPEGDTLAPPADELLTNALITDKAA
jgi:lambda family phage portal protein